MEDKIQLYGDYVGTAEGECFVGAFYDDTGFYGLIKDAKGIEIKIPAKQDLERGIVRIGMLKEEVLTAFKKHTGNDLDLSDFEGILIFQSIGYVAKDWKRKKKESCGY